MFRKIGLQITQLQIVHNYMSLSIPFEQTMYPIQTSENIIHYIPVSFK